MKAQRHLGIFSKVIEQKEVEQMGAPIPRPAWLSSTFPCHACETPTQYEGEGVMNGLTWRWGDEIYSRIQLCIYEKVIPGEKGK